MKLEKEDGKVVEEEKRRQYSNLVPDGLNPVNSGSTPEAHSNFVSLLWESIIHDKISLPSVFL